MYKILIVDDEKIERRGIKSLLKKLNIELEIHETSNGKEALEYLLENEIDILFTDIKMPFMDGIELIENVKNNNLDIKIVIFSGYEEFEYAKFATKMGVQDYILKPVNPKEFEATVLKIINNLNLEVKEFFKSIPEINENKLKEDIDKIYKCDDFFGVMEIINMYLKRIEKLFLDNPVMMHREIESIKQYIYENYNKDISVEQLAERVCLAPNYLSSVFKKETGENLSKFIKSYRMNKAKEMLDNTYEKIVNISNAVGYPNVSYFCQIFREYFGVTPQKYRDKGEIHEEND